jgi:hypothetical protein
VEGSSKAFDLSTSKIIKASSRAIPVLRFAASASASPVFLAALVAALAAESIFDRSALTI